MRVVDGQLHEIGPKLDWPDDTPVRHEVLTEILFAWMEAVGIDAVVIHPHDPDYGQKMIEHYPDKFAGVFGPGELDDPELVSNVRRLRDRPGTIGLRVSFGKLLSDPQAEKAETRFRAGDFDGVFAACEVEQMPLFCAAFGRCDLVDEVAQRYPKLQIVVDHLGMAQPPFHPRDTPPWAKLGELLDLAKYPNVAVKLCGAPVLSEDGYPFADNGPPLRKMVDAFGAGRLLWASDIGRFHGRLGWENGHAPVDQKPYPGKHSYAESLFAIRESPDLTVEEKELILGGTVQQLLGWPA
jgi:predicted TIM-barrel fold metal-dependent hydrolase